jgi:hypothetical protein
MRKDQLSPKESVPPSAETAVFVLLFIRCLGCGALVEYKSANHVNPLSTCVLNMRHISDCTSNLFRIVFATAEKEIHSFHFRNVLRISDVSLR